SRPRCTPRVPDGCVAARTQSSGSIASVLDSTWSCLDIDIHVAAGTYRGGSELVGRLRPHPHALGPSHAALLAPRRECGSSSAFQNDRETRASWHPVDPSSHGSLPVAASATEPRSSKECLP